MLEGEGGDLLHGGLRVLAALGNAALELVHEDVLLLLLVGLARLLDEVCRLSDEVHRRLAGAAQLLAVALCI